MGVRGKNVTAVRRTSFYFSTIAMVALESIRRQTRLADGADVIRVAVNAYIEILDFSDSGNKILVRDKTGQEFVYSPYRPFEYPGLKLPSLELKPEAQEVLPKTFFFSGDFIDKVDQITARGYVRNNSDAIRAALAAYRELIAIVSVGDEIVVRARDGQQFLFNPDAPSAPRSSSYLSPEQSTVPVLHGDLVPGG